MFGASVPISVAGKPTQTQIVINYTATTSAACTVSVTDNNGGTNPPRDLDPALFTSANSDLGRTLANGFRWPTIVNGLNRTVFLGGHDEIKKGTDGNYYSTALQVNTDHTISVSCNGGADTGTIHVSTANLMAGSNYPELPIPVAGTALGGWPQPTVFYGGCSGGDPKCTKVNYIDPITGVLMRRITGPMDRYGADTSPGSVTWGSAAIDRNAAWTTPNNLLTNQVSTTLATTSTQNAPIFAPFASGLFAGYYDHVTDIKAAVYGSASVAGLHVGVCLSQDSGQTCASGEQSIALTTTTGVQANIPSGFPSNYFTSWGAWNNAFAWGSYDISNRSITGVSVSGSTVTITTPAAPGFNIERKAGSVFTLTSCATGGPLTLHVSSVDTYAQITTTESGNTATNCTYTDMASGVRVRLIDAGTVNLSLTSQYQSGGGDGSGSNGDVYYCAKSKVTDITTDCDGVTHSPAISGYMCSFTNGVYLIQDNGRSCLQSNYFFASGHIKNVGNSPSGWLDNKTFVAGDYQNPQHIWKISANKLGNYTEYVPGLTTVPDGFTYTDLGTATNVNTKVNTAGGFVANQLATGLWGSLGFRQNIDGYSEWATCAGKFDPYCMFAYTDATGNLLSSIAPWNSYPMRWSIIHMVPLGFGGWAITGSGGYNIQYGVDSTVALGGPWLMRTVSVQKNGSFVTHSMSVSAATNASPAVLTITGADLDVIDNNASREGTPVTCSGGTGSWVALNTTLFLHYVDNNTWKVYKDATVPTPLDSSTGFGAYPGGVTCTASPSIYTIPISSVPGDGTTACAGAACARVALNLTDPGFTNFMRSGASPVKDADPVVFSALDANKNELMSQTTQYYAKVTGVPVGNIDIYSDAALTQHVANSAISAASGGTVSYAETCPDPSTVTLPGPIYGDSGWGTTGALKVRCVTVTVSSEPCSDYAATGEQAKYPCPADPANTARSSLMNIAVGDGLVHASDVPYFANHEIFTVLKKNKISETNIQLTLMRWSVDQVLGRGWNNCRTCDHYANVHNYGLTLTPYPLAFIGATNFASGATGYTPMSPFVVNLSSHSDFSIGSGPSNIMRAMEYQSQVETGTDADDVIDLPMSQASTYIGTTLHNYDPVWNGDKSDTVHGLALAQTYANFRQIYGQFEGPLTRADWMAQQSGNGGNGQNNHDGSDWTRTLTKVAGTNWTYKITSPTSMNVKVAQYLVSAWPHQYFIDKSGPGSTIGDGDLGKMCHAFAAGECVAGSAAGDTYIAMQGVWDPGRCVTNNQTFGAPCVAGLSAGTGWAVQFLMQPVDMQAKHWRRLTLGWTAPLAHYTFHHWDAGPDNKWGLFASNPVQFRENYTSYQGAHYWWMKLPAWNTVEDSVDRSGFVQVPVRVGAGSTGDTVRVGFGYGENGDPSKLYCTSRAEACYTTTAATVSNPFVFASEAQSWQTCDTGCTVNVPAIAGRTLFYQIQRKNLAGVITSDDVKALPLP